MVTGSANATSDLVTPLPRQTGQAPIELKLNNPAGYPVSLEKMYRIASIIAIYVASVERLEIPIMPCATMSASGYVLGNASNVSEHFPEPDTSQMETKTLLGI